MKSLYLFKKTKLTILRIVFLRNQIGTAGEKTKYTNSPHRNSFIKT